MQEFNPSKIKQEDLIQVRKTDLGLSDSEVFVFSLNNEDYVLKLFGKNGYPSNEAAALKLLNSLEKSYVPELIYFDKRGKYFSKPAVITRKMGGVRADEWLASAAEPKYYWDLYIKRVTDFYSSLTQIGVGKPFSSLAKESFIKYGDSFNMHIMRGLEIFGAPCLKAKIFNDLHFTRIQNQLNVALACLDNKYNFCFGDTLLKNSLVYEDDIIVLDWEYAHFGHRFRDWGSFIVDIFRGNDCLDDARKLSERFCSLVGIESKELKPFALYRCVVEAGALLYANLPEEASKIAKISHKIGQNLN
jgi:hypothetical protein